MGIKFSSAEDANKMNLIRWSSESVTSCKSCGYCDSCTRCPPARLWLLQRWRWVALFKANETVRVSAISLWLNRLLDAICYDAFMPPLTVINVICKALSQDGLAFTQRCSSQAQTGWKTNHEEQVVHVRVLPTAIQMCGSNMRTLTNSITGKMQMFLSEEAHVCLY